MKNKKEKRNFYAVDKQSALRQKSNENIFNALKNIQKHYKRENFDLMHQTFDFHYFTKKPITDEIIEHVVATNLLFVAMHDKLYLILNYRNLNDKLEESYYNNSSDPKRSQMKILSNYAIHYFSLKKNITDLNVPFAELDDDCLKMMSDAYEIQIRFSAKYEINNAKPIKSYEEMNKMFPERLDVDECSTVILKRTLKSA